MKFEEIRNLVDDQLERFDTDATEAVIGECDFATIIFNYSTFGLQNFLSVIVYHIKNGDELCDQYFFKWIDTERIIGFHGSDILTDDEYNKLIEIIRLTNYNI